MLNDHGMSRCATAASRALASPATSNIAGGVHSLADGTGLPRLHARTPAGPGGRTQLAHPLDPDHAAPLRHTLRVLNACLEFANEPERRNDPQRPVPHHRPRRTGTTLNAKSWLNRSTAAQC